MNTTEPLTKEDRDFAEEYLQPIHTVRVVQPENEHRCVTCEDPIAPGRAGRECARCRNLCPTVE